MSVGILLFDQTESKAVMNKYIVFIITFFLLSCSDYKGEKGNIHYDSVEITFTGYDHEIEGELKISITDSLKVEKLNYLKNKSKLDWFSIPDKGTEYVIRLVYLNADTGEKLLVSISKSIDWSPTIEYGSGTLFEGKYQNEELAEYVISLIEQRHINQGYKE